MPNDTIRRAAATVRGWFSQKRRAYIYRVLAGAGVLAGFYGVLTSEELLVWGGFLTTVLNVLPTANTTTKDAGEDGAVDLGGAVGLLVVVILVIIVLRLLGLL